MENLLDIINFIQLNTWDINRIFQNDELEGMVPLSSLLKHYQKSISKEEAIEKNLYIVSKISFGGILYLNDFDKIYSVKGSLYEIPKNAITYSKINVRHGCCYWNTMQNSVLASSEYPVFLVDESKALPEYLIMVLRHPQTLKQFNSKLRGFTKARVSVSEFLLTKIPLPSLEKQKELVEQYNNLLNLAKDKENQAEIIEKSIDDYLIAELDIEDNLTTNINLFQTVEYKNLDKWVLDASYSIRSKYKIFSFDEVCSKITDGTHQTPEYVSQGITFLSAKDVTSQELSLKNVKYIPLHLHNQLKSRCLPQKDDILLAKNGTTGVAALFTLDYEVSIYVSLALLRCNLQFITPKFLLYYINSKFAKEQFDKGLIGVGVPNLHLSVIRNTLIPLPPLDIQNQIVEEISHRKEQSTNLREESAKLRLQAISNFEKEVFN